jgi:NADH-quinone oxidoreductase subunit N
MNIPFTWPALGPIFPEIVLICIGIVLICMDIFAEKQRELLPWMTVVGVITVIAMLAGQESTTGFGGMFVTDSYSLFFKIICLIGVLMTALMSEHYLRVEKSSHGEYYSLMIFAAVGMMVMASAADLIVLYVGLELMALSVYCLVGLLKTDTRANEAAMKYFLLGAFSSAFLLFGMSIIYGMTGTTDIAEIARYTAASNLLGNPTLLAALGMMMAAFCFKVAAAPFHFWAPDVYEGAPTSVTAFMSVGPKAASFAVFGRVLLIGFPGIHDHWGTLLVGIALLTMAIGNITALTQTSIKRMLAYSSIAHAGYALLGVLSGTAAGLSATMNYLLIYAFMNMGTFAILILMCDSDNRRESLDDYKGLAKNNPLAAALMLIFLFSLTGIPPTAGFVGKFYLLKEALAAGYTGTVIGAIFFSAISAYFYLRVVRFMYMCDPEEEVSVRYSPGMAAAICIAFIGVIGLGIMPETILDWAASSLLGQ